MRIQYSPSISVFLSVLITVSACQGDAHRMYMDASDSSATNQSSKAHDASAMSLQVITDVLSGVHPKEASVGTSSATPSPNSSSGGSPMSLQISPVQGDKASADAKPMEGMIKASTEEQVAFKYSSEDHEAWFHQFLDAVDNAEEWDTITTILEQGRQRDYLNKCFDWEGDQYAPLHYAAYKGDLEVVKELIENLEVDVNIKTGKYGSTPLHVAASRGCLEVVQYLIECKDIKWNDTDNHRSNVLHYAALGIKGQANTAVIKFLKEEKNANLEELIDGQFSLLHLAVRANNISLVRYLIQQCPDTCNYHMVKTYTDLKEIAHAVHGNEIEKVIQGKLDRLQGPCD